MKENKIEVVILYVLAFIFVIMIGLAILGTINNNKQEQLCLSKGGIPLVIRGQFVQCLKPEFVIPLK